jgi:hypothetical protein
MFRLKKTVIHRGLTAGLQPYFDFAIVNLSSNRGRGYLRLYDASMGPLAGKGMQTPPPRSRST